MVQRPAPTPTSVRFHTSIFSVVCVPQVEWKMNYIKYAKLREYAKHLNNLIGQFFYKQRSYHEESSEK